MENYENKLKKIDYNFIVDKFLRIVLSLLLFLLFITNLIFKNYFFMAFSFICFCFLLGISINIFIKFLLRKNKLDYKKISWNEKINSLKYFYENKVLTYFLEILKENNINNKEKIYTLYNENKSKRNTCILINDKQSLFVIVTTIITIFIQTYNSNNQTFDKNLLSYCFLIFVICVVIYIIYILYRKLFNEIYFRDKENIKIKIERLLLYFYLNYEEYENELKNKCKVYKK